MMYELLPETPAPRIGILLPAGNTTVEEEYPAVLRGSATFHFQRFTTLVRSATDLQVFAAAAGEAGGALRRARVAAVGIAYTAGSFWGGAAFDAELTRVVQERSGVPAITAAGAIVEALASLRITTITVVSPYDAETNRLCRAFFEAAGLHVVSVTGSPPPVPTGDLSHTQVLEMALAGSSGDAEASLLACTALRTLPVIATLERRLARPVVSSNLALLHSLTVLARLPAAARPAIGRLFTEQLPTRSA